MVLLSFSFNFFSEAFIGGLIGSLGVWLVLFFGKRIINSIKLKGITGEYIGYEMKNDEPHSGKTYKVNYSFKKNTFSLNQTSNTKGDWKAEIPISSWNPATGIGNFSYFEGNKYSDGWGVMQIWININDKMIVIESTSKNSDVKSSKYYLKKSS